MSKVVVALPAGRVKQSLLGSALAFVCYLLLQLVCAFLIHREVLPMAFLYPAVCVSAAVSALAGCLYAMGRGKSRSVLTVLAVTAVFLALTLAVALFNGKGVEMEQGVVGVGLSMCAGALMAALVGGGAGSAGRNRKRRRSRKKP